MRELSVAERTLLEPFSIAWMVRTGYGGMHRFAF
jgi:hypothetical protein